MVQAVGKIIFGQLMSLFTCTVNGGTYPIALIHPFDGPLVDRSRHRQNDDLGFIRLRAPRRSASEFISVQSIIRGALVVEDFEMRQAREFLVIDFIDTDMFLRLKGL
jgi:hypothetical protein